VDAGSPLFDFQGVRGSEPITSVGRLVDQFQPRLRRRLLRILRSTAALPVRADDTTCQNERERATDSHLSPLAAAAHELKPSLVREADAESPVSAIDGSGLSIGRSFHLRGRNCQDHLEPGRRLGPGAWYPSTCERGCVIGLEHHVTWTKVIVLERCEHAEP
jgi:hypothetical protein